jgi:hypothetical protein
MNATVILQSLAAPFEPSAVHWKPQTISGNRCLAVAYLDARSVQDRLDEVFGLDWSDTYDVRADGSVLCRLEVVVDGRSVVRSDVGSPSDQPDSGDRLKAAVSDALKRAAIKFGIGRYLYRLPKQWVDYDSQKRQIAQTPQLPVWALPRKAAAITQPQAEELKRMLQTNPRIDPAKFLARYQAKRLTEFPAASWSDALGALKTPPQGILRSEVHAA